MSFHVRRHASAAEWYTEAAPLLLRSEVENNLMLGLGAVAAAKPDKFPRGVNAWTIEDDGVPVAAAFNTPPHNLVLSRCSPAAMEALAVSLQEERHTFPGVIGPDEVPSQFARIWTERTGAAARCRMKQRIHACTRVDPLKPAAGTPRPASQADASLLESWLRAFNIDVGALFDPANTAAAVRGMIDRQEVLLWEQGGEPVSCAQVIRRTPHGVAIAFVYTPPELRGRGFATSCVAELTQRQLDSGCNFCCLYTDLANPTSNAIYARIGYRRVCESDWWEFA